MALAQDVNLVFDFIKQRNWQEIEAVPKFRDILANLLVQAGVKELQKKILQADRGGRVREKTVTMYSVGIDKLSEYAEQNRRAVLKLRK